MPKEISAKYSKYTTIKQDHLRYFLSAYLKIVRSISAKHSWCSNQFFYIDMNSGPGVVNGEKGSPVIFEEIARKERIPHWSLFIDKELKSLQALMGNFEPRNDCMFIHGDNRELLSTCMRLIKNVSNFPQKKPYGLIYSDCNGEVDELPFGIFSEIASLEVSKRIDFLIYMSGTIMKRVRAAHSTRFKDNLLSMMSMIKKKCWIIREPIGPFQWTFLFGSNWNAFPAFKRKGFYPVDSEKGGDIVKTISFTKKELVKSHLP